MAQAQAATSYTDIAAGVIKKMINRAQLRSDITGQPTSIDTEKVRIATVNDWDGSEDLYIYADIPTLHDLGVNNVGNAIPQILMHIPSIAKHCTYKINGVPGTELSALVGRILTQAGVDAQTQQPILAWEGFNDKTATPSITADSYSGVAGLRIEPQTSKDETPDPKKESALQHIAHEIDAKKDAIKASIIRKAGALKDTQGQPLFSQEQLASLQQETLLVKGDDKGYLRDDINIDIGALKTDEETAKRPAEKLSAFDLEQSVLGDTPSETLKDLLLGAVLENVPTLYPKVADPDKIKADLKALVGDRMDLEPLFKHAQFDQSRWFSIGPKSDEPSPITVNVERSIDHLNTLTFHLDLPRGIKATDVTRDIIAFGQQHGLIGNAQTQGAHVMNADEVAQATQQQPANQVEQTSLFGRIAEGLGFGRATGTNG